MAEDLFVMLDETLIAIIRRYTREAGVRELERMLGRLARKVAVRFAEGSTELVTVYLDDLPELLGPERFFVEQMRKVLPKGKEFTLTGHLGDVLKESAMAANSFKICLSFV